MSKPILTEEYSAMVACCSFVRVGQNRQDLVGALLRHIRAKHPNLRQKVERAAMKVARRHNGKGYYDARGEGWRKDKNKQWKEAIRVQALEEMLRAQREQPKKGQR